MTNKQPPPTSTPTEDERSVDFEKRCCYEVLERMQHAGHIAVIHKVAAMDVLFTQRAAAFAQGLEQGREEQYTETRAQWQERSALNSDLDALQSRYDHLSTKLTATEGMLRDERKRFDRLESSAREFLEAEAGRPGLRTANARVRLSDILSPQSTSTKDETSEEP